MQCSMKSCVKTLRWSYCTSVSSIRFICAFPPKCIEAPEARNIRTKFIYERDFKRKLK